MSLTTARPLLHMLYVSWIISGLLIQLFPQLIYLLQDRQCFQSYRCLPTKIPVKHFFALLDASLLRLIATSQTIL